MRSCLPAGKKVRANNAEALLSLYDLRKDQVGVKHYDLWNRTVGKLACSLTADEKADLRRDRIVSPYMQALDRQTLYATWVQRETSDPGAIQLLASTWNLEAYLPVSMTEHLREEIEGTWGEDFDEIVGGTDLCRQHLLRLSKGRSTRDRRSWKSSRKTAASRLLTWRRANDRQQEVGDWLICTVPLGVLKRINIRPPLSASKQDAIRRLSYDSATKVLALTKRRFWEADDGIFGGGSVSDGALASTWYPSDNLEEDPAKSAAPSIFLASYSWGQTARRMTALSDKEIVRELGKLHHSIATDPSLIEHIVTWSWDKHPWSAGAFAMCQPGEHVELFEALVATEGRILLAGEHASFDHSWMQGAIFSGLRAATHILENNR